MKRTTSGRVIDHKQCWQGWEEEEEEELSRAVQRFISLGTTTGKKDVVQKIWTMMRVEDSAQLPSAAWR